MTPNPHISETIGFLRHRVDDRIKDRYLVLELLGGGNFGSVYRVRDEVVGNVLACKEMHVLDNPGTNTNERNDALELFKREALNLATLRHPNIPAAYFEQEDGEWRVCPRCGLDFPDQQTCPEHGVELVSISQRYYLMMDFVDGPMLEDLVVGHIARKGQPPSEEQALGWMAEIGSALESLHRVGIVHRDVKPDNIKIRRGDNAAILLDFGLTKKVGEASGYGTVPMTGTARFGTPGYAPPNPKERENPERRSDIYALGMTLYRVLSGRDPQDAKDLELMKDYSPRHFNSSISYDTERLIALATTVDPRNRYQTMGDFLSDLKAIYDPSGDSWQAPPFTFADGSKARNPAELARQLDRHHQETINYLFDGTLESWLKENGMAAPANAAMNAVKRHAAHPKRALEMFRRSLYPAHATDILPQLEATPAALHFPATLSGTQISLTLQLNNVGAGLAWGEIECRGNDNAPPPEGIEFPAQFDNNKALLEITLDTKKMPLGKGSCALRVLWNGGELEIPITYEILPLELEVKPAKLDFGSIPLGGQAMRQIHIHRKSTFKKGIPHGKLYISPNLSGIQAPDRFDGDEQGAVRISLTINGNEEGIAARRYRGFMQLTTNGGTWRIPVRYAITIPFTKVLFLFAGYALGGGAIAALARLSYAVINPKYYTQWLVHAANADGLMQAVPFDENKLLLVFTGLVMGLAVGSWFCFSEKTENMVHPLRDLLPGIGAILGVPTIWLGAAILHYTFWSFGDWLLWPINNALQLSPNPLWMWGITGAGIGAIAGVSALLRLYGQRWSRYAMWILFGLIFLTLLMIAMLLS